MGVCSSWVSRFKDPVAVNEREGGGPYLVKGSRGFAGSAPKNSRWGASVGGAGAVRQTPTTILPPTFRVNIWLLMLY